MNRYTVPEDLKHYRAEQDDGFQMVPRDIAWAVLLAAGAMLLIFWPYAAIV